MRLLLFAFLHRLSQLKLDRDKALQPNRDLHPKVNYALGEIVAQVEGIRIFC